MPQLPSTATEPTTPADAPRTRRPFVGFLVGVLAVIGVVTVCGLGVVGLAGSGLIALPALTKLLTTEELDRSEPPVLLSIQDLARFVAAEGSYQVVVDLEEDTRYVPDWLMGERTIFLAEGTVDVSVDFGDLAEEAVVVTGDRSAVTVTLPAPVLSEPRIDLAGSRALSQDRGLINRAEDFFGDDVDSRQETLLRAEDLLVEAARASGLTDRAEENTRRTLEGLLRGLGYDAVDVVFEGSAA